MRRALFAAAMVAIYSATQAAEPVHIARVRIASSVDGAMEVFMYWDTVRRRAAESIALIDWVKDGQLQRAEMHVFDCARGFGNYSFDGEFVHQWVDHGATVADATASAICWAAKDLP